MSVPSSKLGPPPPLSRKRVCPSPGTKRGGAHSPAGEGVGEFQFQRQEKKLSTLSTLCFYMSRGCTDESTKDTQRVVNKSVAAAGLLSCQYESGGPRVPIKTIVGGGQVLLVFGGFTT